MLDVISSRCVDLLLAVMDGQYVELCEKHLRTVVAEAMEVFGKGGRDVGVMVEKVQL